MVEYFNETLEDSFMDFIPYSLDITGENLEDLLAYDDLFLDFFNCFLSLPVFPQALFYNRLTGAFDELEDVRPDVTNSLTSLSPSTQYGPTDEEREKMLEWARQERLPLFLRTQLFRELKLVKLLLKPLDNDRQSTSRESSRNIRGYSRASESYISSLSISGEKSTNNNLDDLDFAWEEPDYPALFPYQRPGSRAVSLPAMFFLENGKYDLHPSLTSAKRKSSQPISLKPRSSITTRSSETNSEFHFKFQPITGRTSETSDGQAVLMNSNSWQRNLVRTGEEDLFNENLMNSQLARMGSEVKSKSSHSKAPASSTEEAFLRGARALSAPVNFDHYIHMSDENMQYFENFFGEIEPETDGHSYVQFDEEGVTEEQTEVDMRNMEGRLKMSIQQMKERILGSHSAFEEFRSFLQGTTGEHLLSFWLECENFKDVMEDFDDAENMKTLNNHFKNIQDKFKLKLTQDALDQIIKAATTNMRVSHTIFLRTQYDVLRRLRAYWLPRFLIHCEMTGAVSLNEDETLDLTGQSYQPYKFKFVAQDQKLFKSHGGQSQTPLFPSISCVHSTPVLPEDAKDFASRQHLALSYDTGRISQRRMFPKQRSTVSAKSRRSASSLRKSTKERFVMALSADRLAGGPFQRYLSKLEDQSLLDSLMFWEDVTEFGSTEDKSFDRLLRLCQAWNIFNKYLSEDSPHRIELPRKEIEYLHHCLERAREYMEASLFDHTKILAAEKLEKVWVRFLKEDLKTFLDCRTKAGADSPPSTAEAIEITVTEYDIVIKRPRPWIRRAKATRTPGSTASERARRLNRALLMAEDVDDDKKAKKRAEARERRKEMERARRKAIRAAYARQKASKEQNLTESSMQLAPNATVLEASKIENVPSINEVMENKPVMNMFKKYVSEDDRETNNLMQLYYDLETYFSITSSKSRKETQALHIVKLYLEPDAKRYVNLDNEQLTSQIAEQTEHPSFEILRDVHSFIMPKVEEIFKEFMLKQSEELGVDPQSLATISQAELTLRLSTEQAMMASWDKKKLKGKTELLGKQYLDKIRELEFASVKVNVMEDRASARAAKSKKAAQHSELQKPPKDQDLEDKQAARSKKSNTNQQTEGLTPRQIYEARVRRYQLKTISEKEELENYQGGFMPRKGNNRLLRDDDVRLPLHSYSSIGSQSSLSQASMLGPLPRTARRAGKKKATGRAQPTREHKNELLTALNQSAMGHLSIPMLYFYKYLLKHGHEDETPQIDKDLFFYIEVQKFKDCSHSYSDEELLRGKVQSIVDCFLESCYSPALQIDIPMDMHQKALKAAQRYVTGKEITPTLFDEAQIYIFKDLLLYWAGFRRATTCPSDLVKRPVLKYEKMLRRRLENIQNYQAPSSEFTLPSIPEGAVPSFSISLSEGIRFKVYTPPPPPIVRGHTNLTQDESVTGTPQPDGQLRDHKSSKNGLLFTEGSLVRSRNSSRKSSIAAR
ncbi:uncharacterized protein LOC106067347 isoform X3 [Biomphalaria glabrata]|uniref:Uncharacterized protein LOC106067347 isoform X3 n=1 Tax=Biomphalaria glabrata TaxID=6526 RepID=A0A9W2ZXB2_BIOGL|nr:uncharacterized protein LOC106067347 isoform X3 [Biomphalaria glabrata]